ncbi:hypothetical protein [Streptosporangium saharense]|uniref:hypothetical protein n=1 Tax=Streptosporangium saharense TaxID=1706840 RepID=UPI00343F1665
MTIIVLLVAAAVMAVFAIRNGRLAHRFWAIQRAELERAAAYQTLADAYRGGVPGSRDAAQVRVDQAEQASAAAIARLPRRARNAWRAS